MSVVGSIPMHFRQVVLNCRRQVDLFYRRQKSMFGLGMPELLVILVIILVIFGAGKLPQIGEGLGKGIRNFRKATSKEREEIDVTPKKSDDTAEKK
jgi:sec-independent protein translocase protein TatA